MRAIEVKSAVWAYVHAERNADFGVFFRPVVWVQNIYQGISTISSAEIKSREDETLLGSPSTAKLDRENKEKGWLRHSQGATRDVTGGALMSIVKF